MPILPDRLNTLRARMELSRKELADKTRLIDKVGISERQIARLETGNSNLTDVRDRTLRVLAEALETEPSVLTGDHPLPEEKKSRPEPERVSITALMSNQTRLSFGLIKLRYGINPTAVINMAPLFFTLLAEGSLQWRREKLADFREAAKRVREVKGNADYLSFVNAIYRAEDAADFEEKSIAAADLFGEHVSEDAFNLGCDPSESNPLSDYLRMLADKIGNEELVDIQASIENSALLKGFPSYSVCDAELEKIAANSAVAGLSLRWGCVRLADIPNDLLPREKDSERVKWIEERTPDDVKELALTPIEM